MASRILYFFELFIVTTVQYVQLKVVVLDTWNFLRYSVMSLLLVAFLCFDWPGLAWPLLFGLDFIEFNWIRLDSIEMDLVGVE